jgi:hypothetical protein
VDAAVLRAGVWGYGAAVSVIAAIVAATTAAV